LIVFGNHVKFNQLRDVIAVAEKGSLRAASRHLGLAQSAMTKSIQHLEKELGAPLFERHKRGTVLTPMGALFLQRARIATSELSRAREEVQQHLGGGAGSVVACLSIVPHMVLLPQVLTPFLARYPQVKLTVLEGLGFAAVEKQLRDGTVDFFIGVEPAQRPSAGFAIEKLFDNERLIVARKGHPLRHAKSLAELTGARWVLGSPTYAEVTFAALFKKYRLPVPLQLTFAGSILGQVQVLMSTDMLSVLPRQCLDTAPMKGLLTRVAIREIIHSPPIVLVRRASLPLTPAAEFFCDLARRASVGIGKAA
jgi:DNA-binding transcriptional LysR family regulator